MVNCGSAARIEAELLRSKFIRARGCVVLFCVCAKGESVSRLPPLDKKTRAIFVQRSTTLILWAFSITVKVLSFVETIEF